MHCFDRAQGQGKTWTSKLRLFRCRRRKEIWHLWLRLLWALRKDFCLYSAGPWMSIFASIWKINTNRFDIYSSVHFEHTSIIYIWTQRAHGCQIFASFGIEYNQNVDIYSVVCPKHRVRILHWSRQPHGRQHFGCFGVEHNKQIVIYSLVCLENTAENSLHSAQPCMSKYRMYRERDHPKMRHLWLGPGGTMDVICWLFRNRAHFDTDVLIRKTRF